MISSTVGHFPSYKSSQRVRGFPCGPLWPAILDSTKATGHWWFSHRPLLGVQTDLWCAVWMWGASIASLAVQIRASHGFAYCFLHLCLILLQSLICVYLILFIYIYTVYYIYRVYKYVAHLCWGGFGRKPTRSLMCCCLFWEHDIANP